MGKKGNFEFNSDDDLDFGGEMFPFDDSAFDDSGMDFLEGIGEKGGETQQKSGFGGFFKNTIKSVKGLGVDVLNEFMPEMIDLKESISSSVRDLKSTALNKKDEFMEKIAAEKEKRGNKSIRDSIKSSFKGTLDNIKQGKFYKSELDMSDTNFDDLFGDDDDDDDWGGGSESRDESGILTTAYTPTSFKQKPVKVVVNSNNSATISAMESIQESSVAATARINTKLSNKQNMVLEQNFAVQRAYLSNIASNLQNVVGYLSHEGVTSLRAQMEYSAKSLAFMTDQNSLLKEQIKLQNKALGVDLDKIRMEEESKRDEKDMKAFKNGSFNSSGYVNKIIENAKDAFMGTQVGFGIDSLMQMKEMTESMGKMMTPGMLIKGMIKSSLFGTLFNDKTKATFEKLNSAFQSLPQAIAARFTKMRGQDGIVGALGDILGVEDMKNFHVNMGADNLTESVAFDGATKMAVTEEIPQWLSKIHQAITGKKAEYFDKSENRFYTIESKKQKYEMHKDQTIAQDYEFSSKLDNVNNRLDVNKFKNKSFSYKVEGKFGTETKTINANVDKLKEQQGVAFKLFRDNLIKANVFLDIGNLMKGFEKAKEGDSEAGSYFNKVFKGFDQKFGDNSIFLKQMLVESFYTESRRDPHFEAVINSKIPVLASKLEEEMKAFKKNAKLTGGSAAMSEIDFEEAMEDYEFRTMNTRHLNAALNSKNELRKATAHINLANEKRSIFQRTGGVVKIDDTENIEETSGKYLGQIYDTLVKGIPVFMLSSEDAAARAAQLNKVSTERDLKIKEKKEKEEREIREKADAEEILRREVGKAAQFQKAIKFNRGKIGGDFAEGVRNILGLDDAASAMNTAIASALGFVTGNPEQYKAMLDTPTYATADLEDEVKRLDKYKREQHKQFKERMENLKNSEYKGKSKIGKAAHGIGKKIGGITERISQAGSDFKNKTATVGTKRKIKIDKLKTSMKEGYDKLIKDMIKESPELITRFNKINGLGKSVGLTVYIPDIEEEENESIKAIWSMLNNKISYNIELVDFLDEDVDIIVGKPKQGEIPDKNVLRFPAATTFDEIEKTFLKITDPSIIGNNPCSDIIGRPTNGYSESMPNYWQMPV